MKEFITFEEAIRKNVIKEGDKVNPHKLYSENKEVTLLPEETGWEKSQIFNREEDLFFFYAENRDGIPTLWGDVTKTRLSLYGEIGALRGVQAINKCAVPYSNLRMDMVARAVDENDLDIVFSLKHSNNSAWGLGSSFGDNPDDVCFGVRLVYCSRVGNYYLFYSDGYAYDGSFGVRPAVSIYLPSKILVDIEESKKQETWILVPNNNE